MDLRSNYESLGSINFKRLSDDQAKAIHSASIDILEGVGVRIHDEEALQLLKKNGAHVSDGNLAYIPAVLVERALRTVPKRVSLWDQSGKRKLKLEDYNSYFGPGSDCPFILDHRTGKRRHALLSDVQDAMKVCEQLPNIDFVMTMFIPSDIYPRDSYLKQMEVVLNHTTKPVVFVADNLQDCRKCVEMAETVAGGAEALRRQPTIALYDEPITPLVHHKDSMQKLLYMAEKGLPCLFIPGMKPGMTAPVTWAGAMAYSNAGTLTGLVLSQLKREGAPFICRGGAMGTPDMRTMVFAYGAPGGRGYEPDLARFYGLPTFGLAGCSDAKVVDGQAAMEASLTLLADALAGANLIHDLGYIEAGLSGSLQLLVICNEVIGWIKRYMRGLKIDDENLCFDVITEAGPSNGFVTADHTYRHFREEWIPELSDRQNFQNWEKSGSLTLQDRAKIKVEELLASYVSPVLSNDIKNQLAKMSTLNG